MEQDHTHDTERSLLAALLFSGEPPKQILAAATESDFATAGYGSLWAWAAAAPSVTPMAMAQEAKRLGLPYDVSYLLGLAQHCGTYVLWQEIAAEVRRLSCMRAIHAAITELAAEATVPGACPATLADKGAQKLLTIGQGARTSEFRTVSELVPEALEYIRALREQNGAAVGVPCGYDQVDAISPLRPGEMTILAARTGIGKSALAINMATAMARLRFPVGYVSLEMTAAALTRRILQAEAKQSIVEAVADRRSDYALNRLLTTGETLRDFPLVLHQPGRLTVSGLRRAARQMQAQYHIASLFVDYLQLVLPDQQNRNRNRENEVAEVSASAKGIAMDCGIPVVMLAQLNRQAEGEKPRLSHLRDSGSIEQDADVVWLLDRDRQDASGTTALIIAKNRDGEGGVKIPLRFDAGTTRFWPGGEARYTGGTKGQRVDDATAEQVAGEAWA